MRYTNRILYFTLATITVLKIVVQHLWRRLLNYRDKSARIIKNINTASALEQQLSWLMWLTTARNKSCHIDIRRSNYPVPCARTATGQQSFAVNGQATWNRLPPERLQTGTENAPVLDRPVPLRRLHDSGACYKYTYFLTYLCLRVYPMQIQLHTHIPHTDQYVCHEDTAVEVHTSRRWHFHWPCSELCPSYKSPALHLCSVALEYGPTVMTKSHFSQSVAASQ